MSSSEQARADAIADAETWMLFATDTEQSGHSLDSEDYGAGAAELTKSGDDRWAADWAFWAARAAFRAVPGLKG